MSKTQCYGSLNWELIEEKVCNALLEKIPEAPKCLYDDFRLEYTLRDIVVLIKSSEGCIRRYTGEANDLKKYAFRIKDHVLADAYDLE